MGVTLKSKLPAIRAELRPRVSAAVKAGAESVAEAARGRAPEETGALKKSIEVKRKGPAMYAVDVGVFYAHWQEFGSHHQPARPFLVPALEEKAVEIREEVEASLREL